MYNRTNKEYIYRFIKNYNNILINDLDDDFKREKVEFKNRKFRRSIFTKKVIKKGEKFTKHNLQILRPAIGISPYYYEKLLKQKSPFNFKKNSHLPKSLIRALKLDF